RPASPGLAGDQAPAPRMERFPRVGQDRRAGGSGDDVNMARRGQQQAAAPPESPRDEDTPTRYAVGIDLGTTNSVVAYARLDEEHPRVELLPIPQLVAQATVESRSMLPSFLYLGTDDEAAGGAFKLPWAD